MDEQEKKARDRLLNAIEHQLIQTDHSPDRSLELLTPLVDALIRSAKPKADISFEMDGNRLRLSVDKRLVFVGERSIEQLKKHDTMCVCDHPRSQHEHMTSAHGAPVLGCTVPDCACGPGCIHGGFVDKMNPHNSV